MGVAERLKHPLVLQRVHRPPNYHTQQLSEKHSVAVHTSETVLVSGPSPDSTGTLHRGAWIGLTCQSAGHMALSLATQLNPEAAYSSARVQKRGHILPTSEREACRTE